MKILQRLIVLIGMCVMVPASYATAPDLKTPSPVIYLADNLNEKDNLGWCIDTLGRGFAERLQAHSCKPRGGDVQFRFDHQTGQIRSVAFTEFCMANRPDSQTRFGLETCDSQLPEQRFRYDGESQEIKPSSDQAMCVAVGQQSKSAGPFMSRELLLVSCSQTDSVFKQWVVVD